MTESTPRALLSPRFATALAFAAGLHASQLRKGTTIPYISHPLGVAALALEHGAGEDEAIAAVLHDAVEDQGGLSTAATIRHLYGPRVHEIVMGCSDSDGSTPRPPSETRKQATIRHLHAETDLSILLVAAADKLHNARTILLDLEAVPDPAEVWGRFNVGRDATIAYYRELAEVLGRKEREGVVRIAKELARVVQGMEAFGGAEAKSEPSTI